MIYKKYDCNSFTVHTVKTDKFKSCTMEIVFRSPIDKSKITETNMICDLLTQSSKKFPKRKDIVAHSEYLYNLKTRMLAYRIGKTHFKSFITSFLDPKYCDKGTLNEVLDFTFELLLNPNVKNEEFDLRSFNIIKNRLISDIQSIKESPAKYAFRRSFINMDEESPISYSMDGYLEDFDSITPASLYKSYKEMLDTNLCDIFVAGNLDMDSFVEEIKKRFKNFIIKDYVSELYSTSKIRKKPQVVKEKDNYTQANLIMICNLCDMTEREKNFVIHIYNMLLGAGSLETKLAKYLREQNSLCYSVSSRYQKYDQLLLISAGIDKSNFDKAVKLSKKALKELQVGDITEEEIENAKVNIVSSIHMAQDSLSGIVGNYMFNYLDNLPLFDERIVGIKSVTKDEIIALAKKIKINTIYLLSDSEEK